MEALPGFGRHLGYDGVALPSHSTGRKNAASGRRRTRTRVGLAVCVMMALALAAAEAAPTRCARW